MKNQITHYTSQDVVECLNAADTVSGSIQQVFNQFYAENRLTEILKALNYIRADLGTGEELNRKIDITRTQVKRTCKVNDITPVGIKWSKQADSYIFVEKVEKEKEKDMFMTAVAEFRAAGATEEQKQMVMHLMTSLLES